ncbi:MULTISPECIES: trigger factor [Suilimivivens]|uniref:Trigger factor n=1 Tax=Suilimivivens aceti TaxID=2981774 RepID=A0ABT2T4W1_9FIRM|nr:trigger factor [Suilimivivens aceti]MCU6745011.1 trigger factor [Suilimivivens aceti]SCI02171.1 Trigger factor [uncultured Clostridium sp.]
MSVQVEKLEKNMAKLTIEVAPEELEKAIEGAYQKNKSKISVPGFRKGKVPRQMIERMYGKEVFYEDAVNALIPEAYEKAVDECEEEIVSSPKIEVAQVEAGKPFIFTAEVALKPEVKLGKYKGVKVEKADTEVTDEEVDKEIDKERESNARNIDVTDRAVKDGDIVTLDFEGFVDGTAFEGGKGENYPLTIGSGTFIPGFEEQLVGAEIGKETEVNVTFPEDYQAEDLKGKAAVFKCTVKEIKEKELPTLDDEFASEVSEFETLAEYKADIRGRLEERKAKAAREAKEAAVIEEIIKDSDMEIPEAMIETQQRQMIDEFAQRIQMQGLTLEQYFQFTGASYDQMIEQVKPQAEKRIQSRLVLEAVAAAEKIEATEEDYEEELKSMAEAYQMEVDKVKELLPEKSVQQIKEDIAVKKAAEFVVDNAKEK